MGVYVLNSGIAVPGSYQAEDMRPCTAMQTLDLHAHFPMHMALPTMPRDVGGDAARSVLFRLANLFFNNNWGRFRVTPETIREGAIAAFGSVLYDPADEFRLGHDSPPDAFTHILAQIDAVEQAVEDNAGLEIAHNVAELEACLLKERSVAFHCMEGAVGLSGDPGHVSELARHGIAYLIVAHLFFKGAATCANAIPFLTDAQFASINNQPAGVGLTDHGRDVVKECFRNGIIVDLTHCTDLAVDDIFELHASSGEFRDTPIISSHNSVRGIAAHPLNLADRTIDRIRQTNGVIGVIFYPHWLLPPGANGSSRDHIDLVFNAIDYIRSHTGSYDNIAIGSDLDGFITPVKEFQTMRDVPTVQDAFSHRYGCAVAEQLLRDNALRVLKYGWRSGNGHE